ncbi:hypothetical protein N752_26185 [Desulforamulus aquiferis]|nr:HAMP domain-containing sensor histidine kinase [Desulforamulus aquiferis]RYD02198.1 hypothetical protein N752_26185 [Desulforamulus aquiferis]
MAAGIGHEVRNPLTTTRGFLQLLKDKPKYFKEKEIFDLMITELDRANSIITQYLSLSKNQSSEIKLHNLNKIIDNLYPLLQADALNVNHSIHLDKLSVPDIKINRDEIHQLIFNLVRNGLEAMTSVTSGGKITIKTFADDQDTVLAIKDEGPGFAPEVLNKIATPFLTTKEQGTGLGLVTCYSIAERNNAVIEVDTGPKGTTFYVRFKK